MTVQHQTIYTNITITYKAKRGATQRDKIAATQRHPIQTTKLSQKDVTPPAAQQ